MPDPMSIVGVSDPQSQQDELNTKDTYWATLPKDQIGGHLVDKITDYDLYTRTYGHLWLWRRSYYNYYKNFFRGGRLLRAGDIGQYKTGSINHFHSIVQGLLTLVTAQEIKFTPQAINSDHKSQAQCEAAKSILDYDARYDHLEAKLINTVEKGLLYGEGYVFLDFDPNSGNIVNVDPQTQKPVYEGDVTINTYSPADCIRDYSRNSHRNQDWYILRDYKNKWDICTLYPEFADEIKSMSVEKDIQIRRFGHTLTENEEDIICQYTFVHRACPSLPGGRIIKFIDREKILIDSALPFDGESVYRLSPDDQEETTFGYSVSFDLLPIQECIDSLISIIMTNQLTFGVQNIVAPIGTKLSPQQLVDGLNLLLTDMRNGIPQALEMVKTPAEIFQFLNFLIQQMEVISGLNSVSRGVVPENLKSGTALAFVQAQALQANSGLQKSYTRLIEDVGTGYINILKSFANTRKLQAIAGTANSQYLTEFTSDDISKVERVVIESGNPLMNTTAGRIEVANNLLQTGLFKIPEEYLSVVETGQLSSLMENPMAELLHIRQENEALRQGGQCSAFIFDNHPLHIKEHMTVINDVDLRNSTSPDAQMIVQAVSQHIQQHIQLWYQCPPPALAALGIQPPPPMAPPGMPQMPVQPGPTPQGAQQPQASSPQSKASGIKPPQAPHPPSGASPQAAEAMQRAKANLAGPH